MENKDVKHILRAALKTPDMLPTCPFLSTYLYTSRLNHDLTEALLLPDLVTDSHFTNPDKKKSANMHLEI